MKTVFPASPAPGLLTSVQYWPHSEEAVMYWQAPLMIGRLSFHSSSLKPLPFPSSPVLKYITEYYTALVPSLTAVTKLLTNATQGRKGLSCLTVKGQAHRPSSRRVRGWLHRTCSAKQKEMNTGVQLTSFLLKMGFQLWDSATNIQGRSSLLS